MSQRLEQWNDRLHLAVAVSSLWLVGTSPWIAMLRRIPAGAGWLDHAHVGLGFLTLPLGVAYLHSCSREGRWRLYFPLQCARLAAVGNDLAALLRGRLPAAESGGLFGMIEGLLLIALLATGLTGAAWFFTQGSDAALAWRATHLYVARGMIGLLALHVLTVSLHLLDFVRD